MADLEAATHMPNFCYPCLYLVVHGCGYTQEDPWRALVVVVQIGLFQALTRDTRFWQRVGSKTPDPKTMSLVLAELGCMGCLKPKTRDYLIALVKKEGLTALSKMTKTNPIEDLDG